MFQNKLHKKYLRGMYYVILTSKINACEEDKRGHSSSFLIYMALSYVIFFFLAVIDVVF